MKWPWVPFDEVVQDCTGGKPRLLVSSYESAGKLPVIDQGQSFISGYTNNCANACDVQLPCILFGDHTKTFKFLERPFALGADGVKVLVPSSKLDARFGFHYLRTLRFPGDTGYSRHFKFLRRASVPLPPIEEQKRIAAILDKADAIRRKREQAIQLADEFLRSLFLDMFGDPVRNPKGWPVLTFRQVLFEIEAGSSVNGEQRTINPGEKAVLKISAVTRGSFDPLEIKVVASADVPSKPITPNNGDLLFSRANTRELVAATCIVDGDHPNIFLPDKLWRLSVNKHLVTPEYLHFMLSHDRYRKRLTKVATGTSGSMLNISQAKLLSHLLPVPLMTLQKCFSEIVVSRAVLNRRVRSMHAEGKFLLSALSHEAFRSTLIL